MDEQDILEVTMEEDGAEDFGAPADGGGDTGNESKGSKPAKPSDEVKLSKREYDALLKRQAELEDSERYWAEQAKRGAKVKAAADDDPEGEQDDDAEDFGDPETFQEEFSTKGMDALVKRGVLTRKQAMGLIREEAAKAANAAVQRETKKLSRDAELLGQFPELKDENAPLTKATAKIFKEMVAEDSSLKGSAAALKAAARIAKKELEAAEDTRLSRIARQTGDRGRAASFHDDDGDEGLSPLQAQFARMVGVTSETYEKSRAQLFGTTNGNGRRTR